MANEQICSECRSPLPEDAPGGRCPRCLLELGLEELPEEDCREKTLAEKEAAFPEEQPGALIGRYKLIRQIGEGGFGVVYLAEQTEPVRRKVALKIIKLGMDTRQVVARFEAERQALAMMEHPNIAKVLDAGATALGRPYFVMELVEGLKITQYCEQHQLSVAERLKLFIQVCHAIQHAHQKGIIHRDIKPSNVLITAQEGGAVPKVIDFGIAKAIQGRLTEQTLFTGLGRFLGTPAYMSPEQCATQAGGSTDMDTRSDVYSLGILLYELLVGKTPFDTEVLLNAGWDEIQLTIREKEPMRPSARLTEELGGKSKIKAENSKTGEAGEASQCSRSPVQLKEQAQHVRGDLDWIVMKCLEKERTRRYATVNGLATDIQRHLNNEPVLARPPSRLYEFRKTVRRHKFGFAATVAVIISLACGVIASLWQARQQKESRVESDLARRDATKKLWTSYLFEAQGRRHSGESGQRFESLAALSNAAAIRPSVELRSEAMACLALADIRWWEEKGKRFKYHQEESCVDPNLQRYAYGGPGENVSIRRLTDDRELVRLPKVGFPLMNYTFDFAADGRILMVSYGDNRLRLWDWENRQLVLELPRAPVSLSGDSKLLATTESNRVIFYGLPSGQRLKTIIMDAPVSNLGPFGPNGLLAIFSAAGTNLLVMDTRSEKVLTNLTLPTPFGSSAWHPSGRFLATSSDDNFIHVWETTSWQEVQKLQGHKGTIVSVTFSHNGTLLASSGWDGKTCLWDFVNGRKLVTSTTAGVLSFSADDHSLVARAWDLSSFEILEATPELGARTVHQHGFVARAPSGRVFFSSSGRLLAYNLEEGLALFDILKNKVVGILTPDSMSLWGFDARDKNVLGADRDGQVFRWPVRQAETTGAFTVGSIARLDARTIGGGGWMSADHHVCLTIGEGPHGSDGLGLNQGQIFQTDSFKETTRTSVQVGMWFGALNPDGHLAATGAFHRPGVNIWDAQTGKLLKELPTDSDACNVTFSPDGRWLVAGEGTKYQFWQVGTWVRGLKIAQQEGAGFCPMMAFSPDGRVLAGSFAFSKVRLFDAATGTILGDLEAAEPWQVTSLTFSPDGTQLAVAEGLSAVRLWDLRYIREELAKMHLDWDLPPYPQKELAKAMAGK
jgi:serine/threonine protein kinase/WD40 repeat protein